MQLQQRSADLKAAGIRVIPISTDSATQGRRLAARLKLTSLKLYSDTHVAGSASKAFGFWDPRYSISRMGVVIVKHGKVVREFNGEQSVETLLKAAK